MSEKDKEERRQSRTLIPPEVLLAEEPPLVIPEQKMPELSTPKKFEMDKTVTDQLDLEQQQQQQQQYLPASNELDQIDLNIVNLESMNDLRLDQRARSSPSVKDFGNIETYEHRKTASTSNLPKNAEDPEVRLEHGRQYSLDLGPTQDHVIIEIEQERSRKSNERKFKIIVGLVIFGVLFTVTFFMVSWEMGYLNQDESFSTPVFY